MTYFTSLRAALWLLALAVPITLFLAMSFGLLIDALGPSEEQMRAPFPLMVALLSPIGLAASSVATDMAFSDREAAWQFDTFEKPVSLKLRFQRNLALIVYPQCLVLAVAVFRVSGVIDPDPQDLAPIFILVSAIMATIGWLYTNYASALKARQTATIDYFTRVNSDKRHRDHCNALRQFISKGTDGDRDRLGSYTFTPEQIESYFESDITVPEDGKNYSFRDLCGYFIGYLEHVALSARVGIFDFDIVQRQRGRRLMLYHKTLFYVIVSQSDAKKNRFSRQFGYRRGNDMWENFIWLVHWMERKGGADPDTATQHRINPKRTIRPKELAPVSDSSARYIGEVDSA